MVDSGDDAGMYHIAFAETEPTECDRWDDEAPDWSRYREPDLEEEAQRAWDWGSVNFRRRAVLDEWQQTWTPLSPQLSQAFLDRPELLALTRCPRWVVLAAIHREQKLTDALEFAQAVLSHSAGKKR
jgi:hypothetical protein